MKQCIYITFALLLLSACANNAKEASVSDMDFSENEVVGNSNTELDDTAEFSGVDLAEAKLKDYFELLSLQQKHPEFKEDILSQIQNISETDLSISDSMTFISVENIRQIGGVEQVSDSLQKINFQYDLITENETQADSITAVIRTQKVIIEQQEVTATKVTFEKN